MGMNENLVIIDADYSLEGTKGVVKLYCTDSKGKTFLILDSSFQPYFYILSKKGKENQIKKKIEEIDLKKLEISQFSAEIVERNWKNRNTKLIKVIIDNPRRIQDLRDVVKSWKDVEDTFEYDISFYKRYVIDKQIEPMGWIEVSGEEVKEKGNFQVDHIIKAFSIKALDAKKEMRFRVLAFDTE